MKRAGIWVLVLVIVGLLVWAGRAYLQNALNPEPPRPGPKQRAASTHGLPDAVALPGYLRNARQRNLLLFVHGFMSSARDAWQHESGAFWPIVFQNDSRFDAFDIYVAEYPTCVADRPNAELGRLHKWMRDNLTRAGAFQYERIAVIAHSMGGLVTRGMILADLAGAIRPRFATVLFLGTPGTGTAKADALAWLSGRCGANQTRDLETTSGYIQYTHDLWQDWIKTAPPPSLTCVAETRFFKSPTIGPIVTESSAASNCGAVAQRFPDRDHQEIAKVRDADDPEHVWVSEQILAAFPADALSASLPLWAPAAFETEPASWSAAGEASLAVPARWTELALEVSQPTSPGQAWRRRGSVRERVTLAPMPHQPGRFDGDAALGVADGRLTNFTARCVAHCGSVPEGAVSANPDDPGFGQRPRWIGLIAGTARRGGAAITHWRTDVGDPPVWEIAADHEVPSADPRTAPERVWVAEGGTVRVLVPAHATAVNVELRDDQGRRSVYDFSKGVPSDAPFAQLQADQTDKGIVYWLKLLGGG